MPNMHSSPLRVLCLNFQILEFSPELLCEITVKMARTYSLLSEFKHSVMQFQQNFFLLTQDDVPDLT